VTAIAIAKIRFIQAPVGPTLRAGEGENMADIQAEAAKCERSAAAAEIRLRLAVFAG
jgi:hypothetical protein